MSNYTRSLCTVYLLYTINSTLYECWKRVHRKKKLRTSDICLRIL